MNLPCGLPDTRDESQHLRELLDHNTDWIWEVDAQGRYTYVSRMVTAMLGYPPEQVLGKTPFDFMPPAEARRVGQAFGAIVAEQRPFAGLVNRNQRADGSIVVLETSGVPLFDTQGRLVGYRGIDRDISSLGERVLQLEAVYESSPVAQCTIDREGRMVMSNRAMARLLGCEPEQLAHAGLQQLMPEAWQQVQADFGCLDAGGALQEYEFAWRQRWFYVSPQALRDARGDVVGLSMAWLDISARRQAEHHLTEANRLLAQYARQDYLTGLFNRRHLDEQLGAELARARREGQPVSLCMADVDYFKRYNDNLGHLAGDDCLRAVAHALDRSAMRPTDIVGRYGGEEFVFILPATDAAGALSVAEHLCRQVQGLALPHPDSPLRRVSISVGVTTWMPGPAGARHAPHQDGSLAGALLRQADQALYLAKEQGRNRVACLPMELQGATG